MRLAIGPPVAEPHSVDARSEERLINRELSWLAFDRCNLYGARRWAQRPRHPRDAGEISNLSPGAMHSSSKNYLARALFR
jgi:hypothetical protein